MRISIAMATCNGARHLGEQLRSFATQQRLPDELVVADDASTDDTRDLVEAFARTAPFAVRLVVNPTRLGLVGNFERALSIASGDLVFLSDQDDVWLPEKIAVVAALAEADPAHACFVNDAWLADGELRRVGASKMQRIRAAGLPETAMVMGCCTAFRAELLRLLLPIPPGQRAHDNWLVQMADLLGLTRREAQPLQWYRRHGGNVSDFFVNRLDTPTAPARWRERLEDFGRRTVDGGGLRDEYRFHADAAERLGAAATAGLAAERVARARDRAAARAAQLGRRLGIRALPIWRRPCRVAGLLRSGAYRDCGGPLGAVKDLVVAREPGP